MESRRPDGTHGRRRLRQTLAPLLAIGLLATALVACSQPKPADLHIALVPIATERGTSWEWTPECRVGPRRESGCDPGGPAVGAAQLAGNAWNLGGESTKGMLRMAVDDTGALKVSSDLSSAPPCTKADCIAPQANTWVRSFPSVLYGIDQCNAATSPPQSPSLRLPVQVESLPSLIAATTYNVQAAQITYDIGYDLWLNPSDTKTPCRTDGTLEVMLWTDYAQQSVLPESMKVGTATIPFAIDGVADAGYERWSVFVSNVFHDGHTAPWGGTVWLVPDAGDRVARGTVSVDLGAALHAVGALLERNYGWRNFASKYWLDTVAFGIEFGPNPPDPYGDGPAPFTFELSAYCLASRTTTSAARC